MFTAHSVAVNVETEEKVTVERARELFGRFPGLRVVDDPDQARYPMPVTVEGQDDCVVGRIREDLSHERGLNFWVVGDQLRKGAATNAVQIAELLGGATPVGSSIDPGAPSARARPPAGLRRRRVPRLAGPARRADGPGPRRSRRCARSPAARSGSSGASRTDAGVHALGQVASVASPRPDPAGRPSMAALNATLPRDVRVLAARTAPEGFDARRTARLKRYGYLLDHGSRALPVPPRLRVARRPAARRRRDGARPREQLRGKHDFSAFCAAPGRARDPVCHVRAVRVVARSGRIGVLVSADAFLHHMVRNVVGTLVEVGLGRRPPRWVPDVLGEPRPPGRRPDGARRTASTWSACATPGPSFPAAATAGQRVVADGRPRRPGPSGMKALVSALARDRAAARRRVARRGAESPGRIASRSPCGLMLVGAVVAAVHHAEIVAHRVGEPFGTLVLALAVTAIESSLIVSVMLSGGESKAALTRDTMYATVMIIANGVVGACILLGALRHREQASGSRAPGQPWRPLPRS